MSIGFHLSIQWGSLGPAQLGISHGVSGGPLPLGRDPVLQHVFLRDVLQQLRKSPGSVPAAAQLQLPLPVSREIAGKPKPTWQAASANGGDSGSTRLPENFDLRWKEFVPAGMMKKIHHRHTRQIQRVDLDALGQALKDRINQATEMSVPIGFLDWLSFRTLRPEVAQDVADMFYRLFGHASIGWKRAADRLATESPLLVHAAAAGIDEALAKQDYEAVITGVVVATHQDRPEELQRLMAHPNALVRWLIIQSIVKQIPLIAVTDLWRRERPRLEIDLGTKSRVRQFSALMLLGNFALEGVPYAKTRLQELTAAADPVLKALATIHLAIVTRMWSKSRAGRDQLAKTRPKALDARTLFLGLDRCLHEARWDEATHYVALLMQTNDPAILDKLSGSAYAYQPVIEYAMLVEVLSKSQRHEKLAIWEETKTKLLGWLSENDLAVHQQIQIVCDAFIREGIIDAERVKERCLERVDALRAQAN